MTEQVRNNEQLAKKQIALTAVRFMETEIKPITEEELEQMRLKAERRFNALSPLGPDDGTRNWRRKFARRKSAAVELRARLSDQSVATALPDFYPTPEVRERMITYTVSESLKRRPSTQESMSKLRKMAIFARRTPDLGGYLTIVFRLGVRGERAEALVNGAEVTPEQALEHNEEQTDLVKALLGENFGLLQMSARELSERYSSFTDTGAWAIYEQGLGFGISMPTTIDGVSYGLIIKDPKDVMGNPKPSSPWGTTIEEKVVFGNEISDPARIYASY